MKRRSTNPASQSPAASVFVDAFESTETPRRHLSEVFVQDLKGARAGAEDAALRETSALCRLRHGWERVVRCPGCDNVVCASRVQRRTCGWMQALPLPSSSPVALIDEIARTPPQTAP